MNKERAHGCVLVADGNWMFREAARHALARAGYEALQAETPKTAVALMEQEAEAQITGKPPMRLGWKDHRTLDNGALTYRALRLAPMRYQGIGRATGSAAQSRHFTA